MSLGNDTVKAFWWFSQSPVVSGNVVFFTQSNLIQKHDTSTTSTPHCKVQNAAIFHYKPEQHKVHQSTSEVISSLPQIDE